MPIDYHIQVGLQAFVDMWSYVAVIFAAAGMLIGVGGSLSAIGDDAEDSQGLINYVYRVRTGKGSLIVKQARSNMRLDDDVDSTPLDSWARAGFR